MLGLAAPLALLGAALVGPLLLLYLLRRRARRYPVSSLFLWQQLAVMDHGGRSISKPHSSTLLLLELLAIILLSLAAAQPWLRPKVLEPPLTVILDDSLSMRAGGDRAARQAASKALMEELADESRVTWIVAAGKPYVVGPDADVGTAPTSEIPPAVRRRWTCSSPGADLDGALALAMELADGPARALVITDQAPPGWLADVHLARWLAFGQPRPNLAITQAFRYTASGADIASIEIANLAPGSALCQLELRSTRDGGLALSEQRQIELQPGERRRLAIDLPFETRALLATIRPANAVPGGQQPTAGAKTWPDPLPDDNRVELLPQRLRPVRIEVDIHDDLLDRAITRAIDAIEGATAGDDGPATHLVLTDRGDRGPAGHSWVVRFIVEPDIRPYIGPFIMARHPLVDGVRLAGSVWAAGRSPGIPGDPLVMAGSTALISDAVDGLGRHLVRWRLAPSHSTLQAVPEWPILLDNLVRWRREHLDGPRRVNMPVGDLLEITAGPLVSEAVVRSPEGIATRPEIIRGRARHLVTTPGRHEVLLDDQPFAVAANILSARESDLRSCESGAWGARRRAGMVSGSARSPSGNHTNKQAAVSVSLAWTAGLAALCCLALHLAAQRRQGRTMHWAE